jgi:hypothetical protein
MALKLLLTVCGQCVINLAAARSRLRVRVGLHRIEATPDAEAVSLGGLDNVKRELARNFGSFLVARLRRSLKNC